MSRGAGGAVSVDEAQRCRGRNSCGTADVVGDAGEAVEGVIPVARDHAACVCPVLEIVVGIVARILLARASRNGSEANRAGLRRGGSEQAAEGVVDIFSSSP